MACRTFGSAPARGLFWLNTTPQLPSCSACVVKFHTARFASMRFSLIPKIGAMSTCPVVSRFAAVVSSVITRSTIVVGTPAVVADQPPGPQL